MSKEEKTDIEEALHTAVLRNYADVNHAKNFSRNIANLIHLAYMKAPEGSELQSDLASMEQYAVYINLYFQSMEDGLREMLFQAETVEPATNENDTIH